MLCYILLTLFYIVVYSKSHTFAYDFSFLIMEQKQIRATATSARHKTHGKSHHHCPSFRECGQACVYEGVGIQHIVVG